MRDSVKLGALLKPLAHTAFRGPAVQDRDAIVMDGTRAERYEPLTEPRIGVELARVRTPTEAIAFVGRFGMLTEPRAVFASFEPCPAEVRQPFADFERAAGDLRRIYRTVDDVRKAHDGDRAALARVRQDFPPADPDADLRMTTASGPVTIKYRDLHRADDMLFAQDDRSVLIRASTSAANALGQGFLNAFPYVYEPAELFPSEKHAPGGLRIGVLAETVLGSCYLTFAQNLATQPLAICDECNRVYVIEDKRQKFCEPTCANRARFRRFKQQRTAPRARSTRLGHGKTTRTR